MGAVLKRIQPALLVIVETELWPNLLRATGQFGTRIILVNARLSARSFRRYRLLRPLMRRVLDPVDAICAQTAEDAERFRELGARPERIVLAGNLKFDAEPPRFAPFPALLENALNLAGRGPVLVVASTMPGEEALVLEAWGKARARYPTALMVLAPRHPARFDEVAGILAASGHGYVRRTQLAGDEEQISRQVSAPEVVLLDSIGELAGVLSLAQVVFVGGSLVPTGGHNILEATYWAKPVVFGPHMENFRDIARLFHRGQSLFAGSERGRTGRDPTEAVWQPHRRRAMGPARQKGPGGSNGSHGPGAEANRAPARKRPAAGRIKVWRSVRQAKREHGVKHLVGGL